MKKNEFPGFARCMAMMRAQDVMTQEEGFPSLLPRAPEFVHELMAEFAKETDPGLRGWLLELIGEAKSPDAFSLLVENLQGDGEQLRTWAIWGLRLLDTKEARRVLWEVGDSVAH